MEISLSLGSHQRHGSQVNQKGGDKEVARHQSGQEVGAANRRREKALPIPPMHRDKFYYLRDLIIRNLDLHSDKFII